MVRNVCETHDSSKNCTCKCQGQGWINYKINQANLFHLELNIPYLQLPCSDEEFSGNEMSQEEENTPQGKKIEKKIQMKH